MWHLNCWRLLSTSKVQCHGNRSWSSESWRRVKEQSFSNYGGKSWSKGGENDDIQYLYSNKINAIQTFNQLCYMDLYPKRTINGRNDKSWQILHTNSCIWSLYFSLIIGAPFLSLTTIGRCLRSCLIVQPMRRFASKTVFSGFEWNGAIANPKTS